MIIFMSQDFSESGLEEDNTQSNIQRVDSSNAVLAYCILFSLPVVSASGTIMLRNLKSLKHPMTVTFHVSMVSIPFMIIVAMVSGQDIGYYQQFTGVDYINLTLACICYLVTTTFVFLKNKNVDVGTFSPLT